MRVLPEVLAPGLRVVFAAPAVGECAGFVARMERHEPRWVAFNGKQVAQAVARELGHPRPALGPLDWRIGPAEVFVLPSSSGANRRRDYDGRPRRIDWWRELADYVR